MGETHMRESDTLNQNTTSHEGPDAETTLPLQHQWPLLGQKLFTQEHLLTGTSQEGNTMLSGQEERELQERVRHSLITQLYNSGDNYSRDMVYLAFLLLRQGRGGVIVGNPCNIESAGNTQELPYTGLEGYYAGSEQNTGRPGMTREEIIQEEANRGRTLLRSLKTRAIENGTWTAFLHVQRALAGEEPGIKDLRTIQLLWSMVVRQFHVRVYHNSEFEPTLTEQIENTESLLNGISGRTEAGKRSKEVVHAECERLKQEYANLSDAAKEQERQERRKREQIRADRLEEFHYFRDETYRILTEAGQGQYKLGIQDASLANATITETIHLPKIPDRHTYPITNVHLTPEQLEGYLFLARLGTIGGNPLVRSTLVSQ
jgi:hypothetical protein